LKCKHWRNISGLKDKQIVDLIKEDNIDILVDLAGHTSGNKLKVFTHKPAPIQINWLGYPNTTGLKTIDYRFTDNIADPKDESDMFYSEQLIRLDNGFLCYQGNNSIPVCNELPYFNNEYITFASFNNLAKINPQLLKLWSQILLLIPKSKLILKSKQFSDSITNSRYLELFTKEGIEPDRIKLYSWLSDNNEHLKLYNSIDITLDSFPYNGTTTTCESLWMGVPTITLKGTKHASRVGASILTQTGLEEFIVNNEEDYILKAIDMAKHPEYLQSIRKSLRQSMENSTLCNGSLFAKKIEKTYLDLLKKIKS